MHEQSEIGSFLNQNVFDPIARALGFHISGNHHALPDHIVMAMVVALGLVVFAVIIRRKLSVENPTPIQHLLEVALVAIQGFMKEVIGRDIRRYRPLIFALAIYILISNLVGQIPGFVSPTSNLNITASCALCVFIYYNYQGIRKHGILRYLKHFAGPVWWIAWLLFPIEIVSHLARPLSLSMRLYGNILAEELITGSVNAYLPFLASLPVMFLGLIASAIQAFIFILLTMVYISGAVEEGHEEGHVKAEHESPAHTQTQTAAA